MRKTESQFQSNKVTPTALEEIAIEYHLSKAPDIHIENMMQKHEVQWVLDSLQNSRTVIDLGYGDGLIAPLVAENHELVILEGSLTLAQKAQNLLPATVTVIHTMFEDFVPVEPVDAVIASHVLEHVSNPEYLLQKIFSWLKPGGILLVIVPNKESIHRRLAFKMGLIPKLDELSARDYKVGHLRVYDLEELNFQIQKSGFSVETEKGFFLKPLSNNQMIDWSEELITALNSVADELPANICADIGLVSRRNL